MYHVEIYVRVRRACMVEGMSVREASRVFGLHRDTVRKMLAYSAPPGYRRQDPPRRPRLEPFTGVIDAILEADRQVPRKQRHTAKRIFERLREKNRSPRSLVWVKIQSCFSSFYMLMVRSQALTSRFSYGFPIFWVQLPFLLPLRFFPGSST